MNVTQYLNRGLYTVNLLVHQHFVDEKCKRKSKSIKTTPRHILHYLILKYIFKHTMLLYTIRFTLMTNMLSNFDVVIGVVVVVAVTVSHSE